MDTLIIHVLVCVHAEIRVDKDSNDIHIYDGRGSSVVLHTFDKLHNNPVVMMKVIIMFHLEDVTEIFCLHVTYHGTFIYVVY